jgi:acetoin utilization protein AcuB
MLMPPVSRYMSLPPIVRGEPSMTLEQARATLRRHGIRHLPVMRDGRLVGLLSERDLLEHLAAMDPDRVTLDEVLHGAAVPIVAPHDELAMVAELMQARRLDAVAVVDHDRLAGLFTTTDALRALAQITTRAC